MPPSPVPSEPRLPDWEAFYRDYRKPGYVPGFELTSKLGGGMFGLVFRARRQSIGKDYAIKFLQVEDGEVRRAVLSELEQVKHFAQIDHPNLVSIEDRGEVDGIPYLVMQFAGTATLRDLMPAEGTVPTAAQRDELLRCFLQACRGVAALHERSLVHFDVKPANVFVKGSVARIGDYGLSKLVTHSRGSLSMGRGTPYYMAPELLQRRGDHRSDVYSLGVVLYECLCGVVPFRGDSEWEVLRKHESEPPVLPPHLSARERAILHRCLQKDPAARFQSVHDLIAAFDGAAATAHAGWSEATAGAVPPPRPAAAGAAAAPDDPYADLRRVGREALGQAQQVARAAAASAQEIARTAARHAGEVMRDTLARHRGRPWWRWRVVWGLDRQRGRATPPAPPPPAEAPAARRSLFRRHLGTALALGLVGALGVVALIPNRIAPAPSATVGVQSTFAVPLFDAFDVPASFAGAVSMSEPHWAALVERDVALATAELEAHLSRLRDVAPVVLALRSRGGELPSFGAPRLPKHEVEATLRPVVQDYAAAHSERRDLRARLDREPRTAAVLAAQQLESCDFGDDEGLRRAERLHEFLVETTGCHELPLETDADLAPGERRAANRHLGRIWLWFLNEVGHTERTFLAYQRLRRR
jgi:hypothetical protein